MAVRIMIAEDHEVTRLGILSMLNDLPVEVVAQTSTGQETLDRSLALVPEVLLLDIRFPDMDGFAILKHFRQTDQSIRVAIVSTYENPTYVARSIIWGAIDYLPKGMPRVDFSAALSRIVNGEAPDPNGVFCRLQHILARRRDRGSLQGASLTYREYQLLRHLALGLSNHEITLSLEISIETVKEHVQNILRKTDASDRTQLAVWATREGILDLSG